MTIEEAIDNLKSEFIKVISEGNESEIYEKLQKVGLNKEMIENLVTSYQVATQAKNNVGDVWNNQDTVVGDEKNSNVIGLQKAEDIAIEKFWKLTEMYAMLIVARNFKKEELFEELWKVLEKKGIKEEQIPDCMLRTAYKCYKQTQTIPSIEKQNEQLAQQLKQVQGDYRALKEQYEEAQKAVTQKDSEKAELEVEYQKQVRQNEAWRKQLISFIDRFIRRINEDEQEYKKAISQNQLLRNVLGKIKDKINQNYLIRKSFGEILGEEKTEPQLLQTLLKPGDIGLQEARRILSETIIATPESAKEKGRGEEVGQ